MFPHSKVKSIPEVRDSTNVEDEFKLQIRRKMWNSRWNSKSKIELKYGSSECLHPPIPHSASPGDT